MNFCLLKNTETLLAVSTFIGSVAIFSDYLKNTRRDLLGGKDQGKMPFLSLWLCKIIVFSNYLAVFVVWINIALLLIRSSSQEFPQMHKFVAITLFFSVSLLGLVIFLQWTSDFLDRNLRKHKIPRLKDIQGSDIKELEDLGTNGTNQS